MLPYTVTNKYMLIIQVAETNKQQREAEEMGDAMKSLENRTLDSKREMDIIAALDEMKSMKVLNSLRNLCLVDMLWDNLN